LIIVSILKFSVQITLAGEPSGPTTEFQDGFIGIKKTGNQTSAWFPVFLRNGIGNKPISEAMIPSS
jgi:hypothetical protein